MRAIRYRYLVFILLLVSAIVLVLRWWLGPLLPVYTVESMPLVQTVVATGRVMTVSRSQVGSEITGVVLERHVQEGDQVEPGDVLLELRADEISAQVHQVETELTGLATSIRPQAAMVLADAEIQLAQASRETARRRDLAERRLLPTEALEQAEKTEMLARNAFEAARLRLTALAPGNVEERLLLQRLAALQAQLAKTTIRAAASGTVLTRNAEPGDVVQPGRVLFTIALDGSTEIRVLLDERNLSRLALKQNAVAIADAYANKPFPASINFIAPSIDPERGTVEVRLSVVPVPDFLRQDMTVSVNIETGRRQKALVIPNDALTNQDGNIAQVLVLRHGRVQRQAVSLGLLGLAMSEIVSGLNVGDQVLADPTLSLPDRARARAKEVSTSFMRTDVPANRNELPVKLN